MSKKLSNVRISDYEQLMRKMCEGIFCVLNFAADRLQLLSGSTLCGNALSSAQFSNHLKQFRVNSKEYFVTAKGTVNLVKHGSCHLGVIRNIQAFFYNSLINFRHLADTFKSFDN